MKKIKEGIYKHYKGNNYQVIGTAHHSETLEEVVVYKALYDHKEYGKDALWVRPAKMFVEKIEKNGKVLNRFSFEHPSPPHPRVGVGIIVVRKGKVLMGKRKGAHGEGAWSVPGGNLEYGENIEECAVREVFEETGIKIKDTQFITVTNDVFQKENKHYITLWMRASSNSGKIVISEPDKFLEIKWVDPEQLPKPIFLPLVHFLKRYSLTE